MAIKDGYIEGTTFYDNLIGKKYDRLLVLENVGRKNKSDRTRYRCLCDCGNECEVVGRRIACGNTTSCGCYKSDITSERFRKDLTNIRFGKLVALVPTGERNNGRILWKCQCDCGNICEVESSYLLMGWTTHCGCSVCWANIKHGDCGTRLYSIYRGIHDRCLSKNKDSYYRYGGRGITICDEWLDKDTGYIRFKEWALANGYRDDLTIDRIDVNGPYAPWNCRWITQREQQWNRENTIRTKDGISIAQYCEEYGVELYKIHNLIQYKHIDISQMTIEEIHNIFFYTPYLGISNPI